MDIKEIKKLTKQMKLLGLTHLKTADIELTLSPDAVNKTPPAPKVEAAKPLSEEQEKEIKHKIEQVKSLYLGSDELLLDRLFPVQVEQESMDS